MCVYIRMCLCSEKLPILLHFFAEQMSSFVNNEKYSSSLTSVLRDFRHP